MRHAVHYCLFIFFIETETKALRPRKKCKEKEENVGRHVYPVDIWFTLATYIDPEAVLEKPLYKVFRNYMYILLEIY